VVVTQTEAVVVAPWPVDGSRDILEVVVPHPWRRERGIAVTLDDLGRFPRGLGERSITR